MRLEARRRTPAWLRVAAPVGAVLLALLIAGALLLLAGASPLEALKHLFKGAFGSRNALAETGARATPLILTGLAVGIAFRARFWNIGAEGQLYAGALAVTLFGSGMIDLPAFIMIPLLFIVGAIAGGLALLPMALLRQFFKVDEVVTTLLMNFVIILLVGYLLEGPLKDPMSLGWPQSESIIDAGRLPQLLARSRLHLGFIVALVMAVCVWLALGRTVFGFRVKAVGHNPSAASHAGISISRTMLAVAFLSGGMAGMAGVTETAGLKGYLTLDLSPGFGYAGIAVAMLGAMNPLGILFAALFLAVIYVGADSMTRAMNVPTYLTDVTVALTILLVLVSLIVTQYHIRFRSRA